MSNLCREAALGPIRSIDYSDIENISADQVRYRNYCLMEALILVSEITLNIPFSCRLNFMIRPRKIFLKINH